MEETVVTRGGTPLLTNATKVLIGLAHFSNSVDLSHSLNNDSGFSIQNEIEAMLKIPFSPNLYLNA